MVHKTKVVIWILTGSAINLLHPQLIYQPFSFDFKASSIRVSLRTR